MVAGGSKAGWKLVAAEALLVQGSAEKAVTQASEALVLFQQQKSHDGEMAATNVLVDGLMTKDPAAAGELADSAAGMCRDQGDLSGEAAMLLRKAQALLASMQDPYCAAEAGIASCLLFRQVGDSGGEAAALEAAARAHLLYDPEQALQAAKEALALCSAADTAALPRVERTMAAAKAQLATAQQAEQAKSLSCRGQSAPSFKPGGLGGVRPADPEIRQWAAWFFERIR
ncbi:unnamed protein product [Effrenium voratum]|uniref:Uncharacterized protein n=1 Tax=Effrenium voratum TaxID=2562239 RepID=A0AA36N1T6_9DINO|nr:unnamed protein product [Effrenium voratum]CAJ1427553.1 unnamed protein product [Effrenium voratum]